jgi:hypothetical protein
MPDFLSPGLIAGGVAALLVLVIIAVSPESLVGVIGQIFQLLGRGVGVLAGEAELGASTLFGVLGGVFNARREAPTPPTPSQDAVTPRAAPTQGTQGATAQADGQQAPAGQAQATQPAPVQPPRTQAEARARAEAEEVPFSWVAETIFTRLLYLATVIVIIASDFVFAILRLQAVLFTSLQAPIKDLGFLSLLTGGLFVSIVLLTGALTLDFLDVLPRPVRLFPTLSDGMRKALLAISISSFVLSLLVVGALFFEGQLLTSLAATAPVAAVILATVLGILQVLVVFLGAWGAIRGLAILLALVGGLVGIILHLIAVVLQWVSDALDLIGTSIIADLIWGIAAIFGRKRPGERIERTALLTNVLSIVGFGDRSSSFTAVLVQDVLNMYGRAGLLAVGTYSQEPAVRADVQARFGRMGVNNISPLVSNDARPVVFLKNQVLRAYQGKRATNKVVLWIVDGELTTQCTSTLASMKREMPDVSITVLCLLPPGGIRGTEPFTQLKKLATDKQGSAETAIATTIMVDDRSPMYRILGEPDADRLVARSLSGMLLAPLHNPANPSFVTVVRALNEAGQPFAALAVDSAGIVTSTPSGRVGANRTSGSGSVSTELAQARTEEVAKRLLTGSSSTTMQQGPTSTQPALYLNFIVPISAKSAEALEYRGLISNWLADEYAIYLYGVVDGEGVDLSEKNPASQGDRYSQVGVLYGIGDAAPQPQLATAQARVVDAGS